MVISDQILEFFKVFIISTIKMGERIFILLHTNKQVCVIYFVLEKMAHVMKQKVTDKDYKVEY